MLSNKEVSFPHVLSGNPGQRPTAKTKRQLFPSRGKPRRVELKSSPDQRDLSLRGGALPQIEIDQCLIRYASILCESLEIVDRWLVDPDRYLAFQLAGVGILLCIGKIVLGSHGSCDFQSSYWNDVCQPSAVL